MESVRKDIECFFGRLKVQFDTIVDLDTSLVIIETFTPPFATPFAKKGLVRG